MLDSTDEASLVVDPREAAESAGLRYVSDSRPGISRRKSGKGFSYRHPGGGLVRDAATLKRIRSLAIPPAYADVWICPSPNGHIQATGRDARKRKQYRYHPAFRELRESAKYEHVMAFAKALPAIRRRVAADMSQRGLGREKVLAAVVYLLDTTLIRVGNEDYARQNKSYGVTTLQNRHAVVEGSQVRFRFTGKSGKQWSLKVKDRRIARIIKQCQELPGQELLQYVDDHGEEQRVASSDVNAYLKEITGEEITAKDFRTFAGTVLAAIELRELQSFDSAAQAKRNLRQAIERVASRLGNTPTICRKCYIHPEILNGYLDGGLVAGIKTEIEKELRDELAGLEPEEAAVLAILRARLERAGPNGCAP
ncbi:DNA topoisomerase [Methylocella silvestris BL2]|uniref:DNA topoisomerase n=1 Tax=Methylocella silvestris (strain DSM 15510 / CIP 108128 / LMG 27833 / NCIMB 13906 / BL2) TaxID=395965 RepID=B8EKD8_METSB|nr:DNA topoisomerase IB [Methylocella silvestris]ACK50678.1 DNA topoisomerase [Methylocella silvestris BL2]